MQDLKSKMRDLKRQGFSDKEIFAMLNLDCDGASMAIMAATKEKVNLNELREDFLPRAFEILKEVAETGERDSDRIKACQIIIQGEGVLPELSASDWSDRMRRMKLAAGEVIDVEFSNDSSLALVAS